MPVNITIKGIPDDLHQSLKEQAAANHRSLNGEILFVIENGIRRKLFETSAPAPLPPIIMREAADEIRDVHRFTITNEQIDEWKREGRE
ncbi:MAG: hypothetical protein RL177_234 [Bacteroidota bacterium]